MSSEQRAQFINALDLDATARRWVPYGLIIEGRPGPVVFDMAAHIHSSPSPIYPSNVGPQFMQKQSTFAMFRIVSFPASNGA